MKIAGIDYGSKLAGTTVLAYVDQNNLVRLISSTKNRDADQFIKDQIQEHGIIQTFLDAPLSLPGVYRNIEGFNNYFYRQADLDLKAMSPMFLGGLTARAMKLKSELERSGVSTSEVYPSARARQLHLADLNYKKQTRHLGRVAKHLSGTLGFDFDPVQIVNWHQLDALLALDIGHRVMNGIAEIHGHPEEGLIFV